MYPMVWDMARRSFPKFHRGRPVLIAARFRDELLSQHDGVGLQGLLDAHPHEVIRLEASDGAALRDMDTPEDYQHQLRSIPD